MEVIKRDWKKNLIQKWQKCRSQLRNSIKSHKSVTRYLPRSKTWHSSTNSSSNSGGGFIGTNSKVLPKGCFSVYVGPEKKRFVVKAEFANHPLFQILLEDAEMEYGFNSEGPILLPCDVNLFYRVLAEMVNSGGDEIMASPRCNPMIMCSPVHKGYSLLSPSRFLKLNQ